MANFIRKWFFLHKFSNDLEHTITNAVIKQKKKPIQRAIINSLKNEIDEWEFIKGKYSPFDRLSSYSFVNKKKHISFICSSGWLSSNVIKFTEPVILELKDDDSNKLNEYITHIWNSKMIDEKAFLHEHVNAENGFYYKEVEKGNINLLDFKFWCANNCEGKYYISNNKIPSAPKRIKDIGEKIEWKKHQEESGYYSYYKCWFEYKSDIVSIKLDKGW